METTNLQLALTSLENRFRELSSLGEQQIQTHENTILELQERLSHAIGSQKDAELKLQYCESASIGQQETYAQEVESLQDKLKRRDEEVGYLRVRCEVLLQQNERTEAYQAEILRLNQYIDQSRLEDQHLVDQLGQALAEIEEQKKMANHLKHELQNTRKQIETLRCLFHD
jgi:chromosome segregation ATPase